MRLASHARQPPPRRPAGKGSKACYSSGEVKSSIVTVPVQRMTHESKRDQDLLAVEEPLQIRLNERDLAITMRTPGNDGELAVGFLFTEGILAGRDAVAGIVEGDNSIDVKLTSEAPLDVSAQTR